MKVNTIDREQMEDVRRKKIIWWIAAAVVITAVLLCIILSHMTVFHVDTKEALEVIKELEKKDVTKIQAEIEKLEEEEKKTEEERENRSLSEKFQNAVILGDSITTGFLEYEILDSSKVVAQKGVHLSQLDEMIETVVNLNPTTLFFTVGHNDVSLTNGDTESFMESYESVIKELQKKLPNTEIYVVSLLPVQEQAIETYPAYAYMDEYNEVLKQFCTEENLIFIDSTELVKEEYYEPDGEHMKIEFYPVWGEYMAEVAGI